jgi:DNA-binding MarR family transcriptional regulator
MMMFQDLSTNLVPEHERSVNDTKELVARVLLEHGSQSSPPHLLSQHDIALQAGLDWEAVHLVLKSLIKDGAIRTERHRLFVNKEMLRKILEL